MGRDPGRTGPGNRVVAGRRAGDPGRSCRWAGVARDEALISWPVFFSVIEGRVVSYKGG